MISNREDMPKGEQLSAASHSNIAPTLLSALDIYDDNVFTGHDLWSTDNRITLNTKYGNWMLETNDYTVAFSDPIDRLYSTSDYMQRNNIAQDHPDILKQLTSWEKIIARLSIMPTNEGCFDAPKHATDG